MSNIKVVGFPSFIFIFIFLVGCGEGNNEEPDVVEDEIEIEGGTEEERQEVQSLGKQLMAVDNVTAWPNLTELPNGTITATIFNKPSHGEMEGNAEVWASEDGLYWEKRGVPVENEPKTNRMNVAAGLGNDGDLVVVVSGWTLKKTEGGNMDNEDVLPAATARSSDGGRTWSVNKNAFPSNEELDVLPDFWSELIPFGDIHIAEDGSLRVAAYSVNFGSPVDRPENQESTGKAFMLGSENEGRSWEVVGIITEDGYKEAQKEAGFEVATGYNETLIFPLGGGEWIAAARTWPDKRLDLYRSEDDGKNWKYEEPLTGTYQHPGHVLRLNNDHLLLTYGNRSTGGIGFKVSEDEGRTWSDSTLVVDNLIGDSGYPSSVQLPEGEILTAYYAQGVPGHERYHMGTVTWNLDDVLLKRAEMATER